MQSSDAIRFMASHFVEKYGKDMHSHKYEEAKTIIEKSANKKIAKKFKKFIEPLTEDNFDMFKEKPDANIQSEVHMIVTMCAAVSTIDPAILKQISET